MPLRGEDVHTKIGRECDVGRFARLLARQSPLFHVEGRKSSFGAEERLVVHDSLPQVHENSAVGLGGCIVLLKRAKI